MNKLPTSLVMSSASSKFREPRAKTCVTRTFYTAGLTDVHYNTLSEHVNRGYSDVGAAGSQQYIEISEEEKARHNQRSQTAGFEHLVPRAYGNSIHWTARDFCRLAEALSDTDFYQTADNKTQEELLRTTQLVYSCQQGKMVPKLREPRKLFGFSASEFGPQQTARWPAEIQVLNEQIKHIPTVPSQPEPFYKQTGAERTPMSRSHEGGGRVVFEYEPVIGSFFLRSRAGGARTGCKVCTVPLKDENDNTLLFESRFESGNLAKAVQATEFDYELWLRNDLYTNKHTQWFYFRVQNTKANVTYRFTLVNFMKPDSLYNHGMKPLVYSEIDARQKKVGWTRGCSDIKYYRNNIRYNLGKSDRWYYSLTWTYTAQHDNDMVYFSHCYPYTYTDLQDYLNDINNDPVKSKICKQRVLCRTLAGNLVYVLSITSPSKVPEETRHRKAVVVTSRVHPGETNASWMMKGFIDYLVGNSADAKLLRDTFVFKIIPMLNPDGVVVGNYRCSLAGRDLNRNYKSVLKDSFPSIFHTKSMIKKLMEEREVTVYCDLHGHSRRQNVFIYGCDNRGNPQRRLRERVFPVMLGRNAPDKFSYDSCKFKVQKSKEGTGRIVVWNYGIMNSYTMEATFCGSSMGKKKGFHFNQADFESMGYHFCDTLLDYCDPDSTKVANIMLELEDRLKQEILQHLKLKEGQEPADLDDINIDEDFSSDIESSDGGSDSSVSDGLPMHLQYVASKFPKKKRLKSRKERDKHKCSGGGANTNTKEKKPQAVPITTSEKEKSDHKAKPVKPSVGSGKSQQRTKGDHSSSGLPIFTQERSAERNSKKGEGYLDNLTQVLLKNGTIPSEDKQKEVPHFRYTAAARQSASIPVSLDDDLEDIARSRPSTTTTRSRQSNHSRTDPPVVLDRRSSQLHLVELSAAQQREQNRKDQVKQEDSHLEDVNGPIKQHPLPFDQSLEKERSHDTVKRGQSAKSLSVHSTRRSLSSNISSTAATTASGHRIRSARSIASTRGQDMNDVVMLGPAAGNEDLWSANTPVKEDQVSRSPSVGSSVGGVVSQPNVPPYVPSRPHQRPAHHKTPLATNQSLPDTDTHRPPPQDPKRSSSPLLLLPDKRAPKQTDKTKQSPQQQQQMEKRTESNADLNSTIESIKEIREALMDPNKRATLSPTTGQFVEHFIKKTDAEINEITAELQHQLHRAAVAGSSSSSNQQAAAILTKAASGDRNQPSWKQQLSSTSHTEDPESSATKAFKQPRNFNSNNKAPKQLSRLRSQESFGHNGREITLTEPQLTRLVSRGTAADTMPSHPFTGQQSVAYVNINNIGPGLDAPANHGASGSFISEGEEPVRRRRSLRSRGSSEPEGFDSGVERRVTPIPTSGGLMDGVSQSARHITSPTKISLMISRGHHENPEPAPNFQGKPLTRNGERSRPPLFRKKRR